MVMRMLTGPATVQIGLEVFNKTITELPYDLVQLMPSILKPLIREMLVHPHSVFTIVKKGSNLHVCYQNRL